MVLGIVVEGQSVAVVAAVAVAAHSVGVVGVIDYPSCRLVAAVGFSCRAVGPG